MALRIIVGLVGIPIMFFLLYGCDSWGTPLAMTVFSIVSVYELLSATGFVKNKGMVLISILFSALVVPWGYFGSNPTFAYIALFVFVFLLFAIALLDNKTVTFEQICGAFFTGLFVPLAFSSVIRIREMNKGDFLVLLPFFASWFSDTFAYFTGIFFGKHKLAPAISPKKTIEGSIGGIVGAVAGCMIYAVVCHVWFRYEAPIAIYGLIALVGSCISQFGDLSMSFVKRKFGLKDFGKILPGHGGVLDRFDSVLFAAPAVEIMLTILIAFAVL